MLISEIIGKTIKDKGLKKGYVASAVGITSSALTGILHGKRTLKADEMLSLCKYLQIDPAIFIKK